ncbi:MAG: hypothetical protein GX278_05535 [Aeromonadales bacterium]|nr:hypothetical protein [Aeromonadales bacterium]
MALRANLRTSSKKGFVQKVLKYVFIALFLLAAVVIGSVLYFNNQNIKAPLLKLISERTSLDINCNKIEFSALYPNILKVEDVTIGKTHIDEVYAEYDLESLVRANTLKLKYFYCRGVKLNDDDLTTLKKERFSFKSIQIDKFDLVDIPFKTRSLDAQNATLSADKTSIDNNGNLTFDTAKLSFAQGTIDEIILKKFSVNLTQSTDVYNLTDLNTQIYGGNISADLSIDKKTHALVFSRLNINNIIFKDYKAISEKYNIYAPEAFVSNSVLVLPKENLLLGQVTGEIKDLSLANSKVLLDFNGNANEISKPNIQLTASKSRVIAHLKPESINLKLDGNIFEGHYSFDADYSLDLDGYNLNINNIEIKDTKLEPTAKLAEYLTNAAYDYNTYIKKAAISNCEYVSNVDSFPLTAKNVNFTASNYCFDKDKRELKGFNGEAKLYIDSAYYKDLFINKITLESTLNDSIFTLKAPEIKLGDSTLFANYNFDYEKKLSSFTAKTDSFDISRLNSGLFNYLFNGKLSFDINLIGSQTPEKTGCSDETLMSHENVIPPYAKEGYGASLQQNTNHFYLSDMYVNGYIKAKGNSSLLVSRLGIDLLNGGEMHDYMLNTEQMLDAISSGDLGLYNLDYNATITNSVAKFKLKTGLTTSHLTSVGTFDLSTNTLKTKATLVSLAKDSVTRIIIKGALGELTYYVNAITRGEIRPGINIKGTDIIYPSDKSLEKETSNKTEDSKEDESEENNGLEIQSNSLE